MLEKRDNEHSFTLRGGRRELSKKMGIEDRKNLSRSGSPNSINLHSGKDKKKGGVGKGGAGKHIRERRVNS